MQKIRIVLFLFAFVMLASFAVASNFEQALQAHDSGDFKKAHKLWLIDAEQGDAAAQVNLGAMYNLGHGVPQDYKESVKWYRLAAEQGNAQAQTIWGLCITWAKVCHKTTRSLSSGSAWLLSREMHMLNTILGLCI